MPATKSFIEVLEDEIRADLRKEIEAEVAARYGAKPAPGERALSAAVHAAGCLETWLASHVGPVTFKPTSKASAYGAAKPGGAKPSPSARQEQPDRRAPALETPRLFSAMTSAELFAIELLNRHSPSKLSSSFTEDELKSVWRKAALKTHPDRFANTDAVTQTRMTVLFRELATAYETLLALVEAPYTAA